MPPANAVLSTCGRYRYSLFRPVHLMTPANVVRSLCWVMLNPSTADALWDDPTIRKVMGFTHRAGYDAFHVVNLFPYRATDPRVLRDLLKGRTPNLTNVFGEGLKNEKTIKSLVVASTGIVCAWGAQPWAREQASVVNMWISDVTFYQGAGRRPIYCLGLTKGGDPKHPLMLSYSTKLVPYQPKGN